jgi:hypothetical protein
MMRKIQSQSEKDRKTRKNQIVIGVILISVMVFSVLGFGFGGNQQENSKETYNGFDFFQENGFWVVELQGNRFYFNYLPRELENISTSGTFDIQDYVDKPLYFVNTQPGAAQIILNNIGGVLLRYQEACVDGESCRNDDLPIKTCGENLIIFSEIDNASSFEARVVKEDSCIYISGDYSKGANALIYDLLGIK